jgi:hypothetical protein
MPDHWPGRRESPGKAMAMVGGEVTRLAAQADLGFRGDPQPSGGSALVVANGLDAHPQRVAARRSDQHRQAGTPGAADAAAGGAVSSRAATRRQAGVAVGGDPDGDAAAGEGAAIAAEHVGRDSGDAPVLDDLGAGHVALRGGAGRGGADAATGVGHRVA